MKRLLTNAWSLTRDTASDWYDDDAPRLAAALAYYALLSAAPIVLLSIAFAGYAFGAEAARGEIAGAIAGVVGDTAAKAIQSIAENARQATGGTLSSIVGIAVLLFGASGAFAELQAALDRIWEVKPKPGRGVLGFLRDRVFSFGMVLAVAFLLLVSLVVSAALSAVGRFLESSLPGGEVIWQIVNFLISFAVVTLLFALILKVVPDVRVRWHDVWIGATVTALLFTIGKTLFAVYLGKSSVASSYGAAGSIVALVLWIYYSSQILFLGAEFTQVYARRFGSRVTPSSNAVPDKAAAATKQAAAHPG